MLKGSQAVVTAWSNKDLVGFGRATSDGPFRAVLWDVVVASKFQGQGVGRSIVKELLEANTVQRAEIVYLMTTNSQLFYEKMDFEVCKRQTAMMLRRQEKTS